MLIVRASPAKVGNETRIKIALADGKMFVGKFETHRDFVMCRNRLGTSEDAIRHLLSLYFESDCTGSEIDLDEFDNKINIALRDSAYFKVRDETGSEVESYSSFVDAFDSAKDSQVIEWSNKSIVCCLDIDLPDDATNDDLTRLVNQFYVLKPKPMATWISKSGKGLHAIYQSVGEFTAEDLASVAGYKVHKYFPLAGIELKTRTRMPPKEFNSDVEFDLYADSTFSVNDVLYEVSGELNELTNVVNEMLDLEAGQRYPHTRCPVAPSPRGLSNTDPVVVYDDHVFCYICNKDHVYYGHNAPGYFPFDALLGLRKESAIKKCVDGFVHWGQAQYVFAKLDYEHVKQLYKALLTVRWGKDPRINYVFIAGMPNGIVRHSGYWADFQGSPLTVDKNSARIAQLPAACYVDPETRQIKVNKATCEWLCETGDLSKYGYMAVRSLKGFQFTFLQDTPSDTVFAVLDSNDVCKPRFLTSKERMPIEEAWGVLEEIFPGLNRNLITGLLIGRGCTEYRAGLDPMLSITGVTGSGKTQSPNIAAAIAGDTVGIVPFKSDMDRFMNGVFNVKKSNGFLLFDEFFKTAVMNKTPPVVAMETLLTFNPNSLIYLVYVGSVPLGTLPMLVWADSELPMEVIQHEQIGRRVYHFHLASSLKWTESMQNAGISDASKLRLTGGKQVNLACDTILTHVVETYFTGTSTDFSVVQELGFRRIEESDLVLEKHNAIREFFAELTNPGRENNLTETDCRRFGKKGWVTATRNNNGDNLMQWFEQCQDEHEHGSTNCRVLVASDLAKILKFKCPAKFEVRRNGAKLFFRFISLDGLICNQELLK